LKLYIAGEKEIAIDCPCWLIGLSSSECQQLEEWVRQQADAIAAGLQRAADEADPTSMAHARRRDRPKATNTFHLLPGIARHAVYLQMEDGIPGLPNNMSSLEAVNAIVIAMAAHDQAKKSGESQEELAYVQYSRPGMPPSATPQYNAPKNRHSFALNETEHTAADLAANRRLSMPVPSIDGHAMHPMTGMPYNNYYGPPMQPYYVPYGMYGGPHSPPTPVYYSYGSPYPPPPPSSMPMPPNSKNSANTPHDARSSPHHSTRTHTTTEEKTTNTSANNTILVATELTQSPDTTTMSKHSTDTSSNSAETKE
jgi:hypothetical protein